MRVRWVVSGRVQGVGYRIFVWREARALQIGGMVRNLADGTVEVIAQGDPRLIDSLEVAIRRGPSHAQVTEVEKSEISDEVTDYNTFYIK